MRKKSVYLSLYKTKCQVAKKLYHHTPKFFLKLLSTALTCPVLCFYSSTVYEKINFNLGEPISIQIINSGTDELKFSDTSYGLIIKQLDSIHIFSPISSQVISKLDSHEEVSFVWDQIKNNGDHILEGTYKITSKAITLDGSIIEKIVIIHVFK